MLTLARWGRGVRACGTAGEESSGRLAAPLIDLQAPSLLLDVPASRSLLIEAASSGG